MEVKSGKIEINDTNKSTVVEFLTRCLDINKTRKEEQKQWQK